jgi:hypothetical protein
VNGVVNGDKKDAAPDPLGKSALFSAPPAARPAARRQARAGKAALYSVAAPASTWRESLPGFSVELVCSSCEVRSRVDMVELALLHMPFFLWVPWLRHSRFIACPACERRTWVRVNWAGVSTPS